MLSLHRDTASTRVTLKVKKVKGGEHVARRCVCACVACVLNIHIYIYMFVCLCVCVCAVFDMSESLFVTQMLVLAGVHTIVFVSPGGVCVCVCTCMYVYMYIYICVCVYVCVYVMFSVVRVWLCVCTLV